MKSNKILVVDDSIDSLKVVISIIKKYFPGHMIYQANSGRVALNILNTIKPDIILTDWDMPEMNGIELLRTIHNQSLTKNIPVIITTGIMISPENLKEALDAGAVDYLRKPVNPTELFARITSAIELAESKKEIIREKEGKIVENAVIKSHIKYHIEELKRLVSKNERGSEDLIRMTTTVKKLINDLEGTIITSNSWNEMRDPFNTIYPGFVKNLLKTHPSLTPTEIKLSIFSRMGLGAKQLALIMYVTPESIRVSKSRLKKKLGLNASQNLQAYLIGL